ncbi:MAG: hypothetical protein QM598_06975, partial [Protaetiibacter sp.]
MGREFCVLATITLVSALLLGANSSCTTTGDRLGNECVGSAIDGDEAVIDANVDASGGGGAGGTGAGGGSAEAAQTPFSDPRDEYDVVNVTLHDIARFRPAPGVQRMEPDGWVVVGLPAN